MNCRTIHQLKWIINMTRDFIGKTADHLAWQTFPLSNIPLRPVSRQTRHIETMLV